jgi:FkbM family methyltransferase
MKSFDSTLLEMFNHVIQSHPQLAPQFESLCAIAQGKGYGSATIVQEIKVLMGLLGAPAALAVDIGGNVGDYTAELRQVNPAMEVHVFEPAAVNLAALHSRYANQADVVIVSKALSNQPGSAQLFSDVAGSGMASLTHRRLDHFGIDFKVQESIETCRFEDYWTGTLQGRTIDIAKLDIEGHELAALQGFGEAIGHTRIIQFEFGGANIDTRTYFQDYWYFFKEHGFELFRITPFGHQAIPAYREADEFFSTTNYLAVNRNTR